MVSFYTQGPDGCAPLLLECIKKVYPLLTTGGTLLIDANPYISHLPATSKEALSMLQKCCQVKLFESTKEKVQGKKEIGVVSHSLQLNDPFSCHLSYREISDIVEHISGRASCSVDSFTHILYADKTLEKLTKILDKNSSIIKSLLEKGLSSIIAPKKMEDDTEEYLDGIVEKTISDDISSAHEDLLETVVDMFEWIYGTLSRGPLIIHALESMGFEVAQKDPMNWYVEINPYNGRKHAWIIEAKKK